MGWFSRGRRCGRSRIRLPIFPSIRLPVHRRCAWGRDQQREPRPSPRPPPTVAPPQRSLRGVTRARRSQSEPRVVFKPAESGRRRGRTGNRHRDRTKPNQTKPGGPTASPNRDRDRHRSGTGSIPGHAARQDSRRECGPELGFGLGVPVGRRGQPWGGSPRERRVRCGPQRSRYLCVCPWVCVCVCVVGEAAGAAAGDPPVPPRRRSGPGAPRCRSCSCSRTPTGPA